jgi:hypothetical protein
MKSALLIFAVLLAIPFTGNTQSIKTLNKPLMEGLDEVTPFHEGLAAVRKGTQWGFIDLDGNLVIDFRSDLVWKEDADPDAYGVNGIAYPRFRDGRCMFQAKGDDEIPVYGFIDKEGSIAIEPEYLNLSEFKDGYAVGIFVKKTFRGKNKFQLNIFDYSFMEAVLNPEGEIVWPVGERQNILMQKRRYELPSLKARTTGNGLLVVETEPGKWEIRHMKLQPATSRL